MDSVSVECERVRRKGGQGTAQFLEVWSGSDLGPTMVLVLRFNFRYV